MRKLLTGIKLLKVAVLSTVVSVTFASCVQPVLAGLNDDPTQDRICGAVDKSNAYNTAWSVAWEYMGDNKTNNMVFVSGNGYADGLSASILSRKLDAPILLVDSTAAKSRDAIFAAECRLRPGGTIYIIGGTGIIGEDFESELQSTWKVKRVAGLDRYDTNAEVLKIEDAPVSTPVFIASGEGFADALSISSFSASKQYPILLVGKDYLSDSVKTYLSKNTPSAVYIAGGVGVISQNVENSVKSLVPGARIQRLAGNDRYDTAKEVAEEFAPTTDWVYLADSSLYQYPLSGSALAAKTNSPILLVDSKSTVLPPSIESYLRGLGSSGSHPRIIALGTEAEVPRILLKQANTVLDGGLQDTSGTATRVDRYKLALAKVDTILASILKPGMSDVEKELAIYDYVVMNTIYNEGFSRATDASMESTTFVGAILNGAAICSGYADTMTVMLNKAGVETMTVDGYGGLGLHAWNIVKLGQEYYELDATADSCRNYKGERQSNTHNAFNLTDAEIKASGLNINEAAYPLYAKCTATTYSYENIK